MPTNDKIGRRSMIKSTVGASVIGLAGCLGDDDDDVAADDTDATDDTVVTDDTNGEDDFPDSIRLLVTTSTGGGSDFYARTLAEFWPQYLPEGTTVEVENLPGAQGAIGLEEVWNSEADGSTTLAAWAPFNMATQLTSDINADYREFEHIGSLSNEPVGLFTRDDLADTYDEFVDEVQTGDTMVGTAGFGGMAHIGAAYVGAVSGDWDFEDLNYTHYDGPVGIVQGMLQEHVDWSPLNSASSAVAFGAAVANSSPMVLYAEEDEYPDWMTDTFAYTAPELGISGWEEISDTYGTHRAFSDPPGTPDSIIETKQEALMDVANDPEFNELMEEETRSVFNPGTAEELNYSELLDEVWDVLTSEPVSSIIESV